MMFKKGQAAMEFLMTYGWAILVVLIAIGALAYFGVLNPNKFIGDRCTLSTGAGIFCTESNSVAATAVNLQLRNGLADAVNITNISLTYNNGANICVDDLISPSSSYLGVPIQPDVVSSAIALDKGALCTGGLTSGSKVKGDLKITYYVGTSSLLKTTTGSLVVTVQ